ncbi:MAG: hypothetical protein H7301_11900 [Cryobacterium sp.]|nr:hypothetical protein [Oligoflexia bacterium]
MDAWVYLFSKFSHEALLFEALALFAGLAGYAIFYLIRKRKYGVAGKDVPSNIIKAYLSQLMVDAEEMNVQLFGLLGRGEAQPRAFGMIHASTDTHHAAVSAAPSSVDPGALEKLKELEKRLAEQANALDTVLNEKMKIEEELATAKADARETGAPLETRSSDGNDKGPLQDRVNQLEAQLAEYAIIEDDLANLKRLQKENKVLKQQIADAGPNTVVGSSTAGASLPNADATSTPNAARTTDASTNLEAKQAKKTALPLPIMGDGETAAQPEIATEVIGDRHAHETSQGGDFESLVDVVEKNLADASSSSPAEIPAEEKKIDEKTEEQLQADFEKMLNS